MFLGHRRRKFEAGDHAAMGAIGKDRFQFGCQQDTRKTLEAVRRPLLLLLFEAMNGPNGYPTVEPIRGG